MIEYPKSREELLARIEREWNELMQAVGKLSPQQMTTPLEGGWTPKDHLAHVREWMNALLGYHLDGKPAHEVMGLPREETEDWDFNKVNAALAEKNRARSAQDVIEDVKAMYAQVIERINETPFDDFMKPRFPEEQDSPPILLFVLDNTSEHFKEHRESMEKAL